MTTMTAQQAPRSRGRFDKTHGHTVHDTKSPTYESWLDMRYRCNNPKRRQANLYIGRGIKVCERWANSFENFLADMGERPEGKTLDRWPNQNGDYEPGNCRWATPREQARNMRSNKLTLETATEIALMRLRGATISSIAAKYGVNDSMVRHIAKGRNWPDALEAAKKILGETNA
jgi:hypothetical protein